MDCLCFLIFCIIQIYYCNSTIFQINDRVQVSISPRPLHDSQPEAARRGEHIGTIIDIQDNDHDQSQLLTIQLESLHDHRVVEQEQRMVSEQHRPVRSHSPLNYGDRVIITDVHSESFGKKGTFDFVQTFRDGNGGLKAMGTVDMDDNKGRMTFDLKYIEHVTTDDNDKLLILSLLSGQQQEEEEEEQQRQQDSRRGYFEGPRINENVATRGTRHVTGDATMDLSNQITEVAMHKLSRGIIISQSSHGRVSPTDEMLEQLDRRQNELQTGYHPEQDDDNDNAADHDN